MRLSLRVSHSVSFRPLPIDRHSLGELLFQILLRTLVTGSSSLLALHTFARRIPPPTAWTHEARRADQSLLLPDLASPANVRISQRQPSIRDLGLPALPALAGTQNMKANQERIDGRRDCSSVVTEKMKTTSMTVPKRNHGHYSSASFSSLQRLRCICNYFFDLTISSQSIETRSSAPRL